MTKSSIFREYSVLISLPERDSLINREVSRADGAGTEFAIGDLIDTAVTGQIHLSLNLLMSKKILRSLPWFNAFGWDPVKSVRAIRNVPKVYRDYRNFQKQSLNSNNKWPIGFNSPNFTDMYESGGSAKGHYFHQDLLVARRIFERRPARHVDVGSRVDGFVAHVAVFREIEVVDIRPIESHVPNITFLKDDLMHPQLGLIDYCDSLSCLHALEHFGLGRYGDPIDPDGYIKGFSALAGMLKQGGILYLSVPVGRKRVEFNGQRVFSIRQVYDLFEANFQLLNFSYVDDLGDLHENVGNLEAYIDDNFNLEYGCGIFELRKLGV
jgi:hypothetical protein